MLSSAMAPTRNWMLASHRTFAFLAGLMMMASVVRSATLGEALNATNLTWTTSGTLGAQGWSAETTTTHDGVAAAMSDVVFSTRISILQTTVTGPGTLTFWWYNPSLNNTLTFSAGGTNLEFINYYTVWDRRTNYFGSGTQTLKWVYTNTYFPGDSYRGYVDEVSWTPGATAPIIIAQPSSQSQVRGLNAVFAVSAGGTPPLSYQWRFNGTDIPGATSSSCMITNVQSTNLGNYSVVVSNDVGSIVSSNAALDFGEITAWGAPGSLVYIATSVTIGATNVQAIAAGYYWGLALKADGTMPAWGINVNGDTNVPTTLTNAIAIEAGLLHGLALKSDGTVAAWGDNLYGQATVPAGLTNVVAISAGQTHSLALRSDGTVVAWGWGSATNVPADLTNAVAIAAGGVFSMVLKSDGTVITPGGPAIPTNLAGVVRIAVGGNHALALLANGTVTAWGQNNYGQADVPAGLTNVVAVAAGGFHNLALLANGTLVAWGYNGAWGVTNVPPGLTNVEAIAAGYEDSLALVGTGPPVVNATISNPRSSGNGFGVTVLSQSGRVYQLQYKNSLGDANWTSLPLVAGNGRDLVLTDGSATNSPRRFYRVLRW